MARLGMVDTENNFLHPRVPEDSDLRKHAHYETGRQRFAADFQVDSVNISKQ